MSSSSVLTAKQPWREDGLYKNFIWYALWTTVDFPFEMYLAARFFLSR